MAVLAIDSSTSQVAVGLVREGRPGIGRRLAGGRRTGSVLPVAVAQLLAEEGLRPAELQAIAVGLGPGPYTSLRVGVMFARAVGLAVGVQVVGACSLDVVARSVGTEADGESFVVASDARRREVYWARYDGEGRRCAGPLVGAPAVVRQVNEGVRWIDAGDEFGPDALVLAAWVASEQGIEEGVGVPRLPWFEQTWDDARADGSAGPSVPQSLLAPEPIYLRKPDAVAPAGLFGGVS